MAEPISSHIFIPHIILIQKRRTKEKEVIFCVINCLIPTAKIYPVKFTSLTFLALIYRLEFWIPKQMCRWSKIGDQSIWIYIFQRKGLLQSTRKKTRCWLVSTPLVNTSVLATWVASNLSEVFPSCHHSLYYNFSFFIKVSS